MRKRLIFSGVILFLSTTCFAQVKLNAGNTAVEINTAAKNYSFLPEFTILYSEQDPGMALKPSGIKKVSYNVLTWKTTDSALADFKQKKVGEETAGDGFDDKILRGKNEMRTADLFQAGQRTTVKANAVIQKGDSLLFSFLDNKQFYLKAWLLTNVKPYPVMQFSFTPYKKGYYSVGYTGAPSFDKKNTTESWQSLIWTEKRTPDIPYLTPSFMATLPTTIVNDGSNTLGVLASPEFLPFQPLPLLTNSQFGVALLNSSGKLQPQVFAPLLGGFNSLMDANSTFNFSFQLVTEPLSLTGTYGKIAETVFGFRDYRQNSIASMNTVMDNLIDYVKTNYAWFVDSLKGFAYSTDVPGAVKNVSSLNPLEMAIVRDDEDLFEKRAYPLMEFMLSREKFLFSLDSTQKIQSPSRKLKGPIAPLSELGALYSIFGKQNSFYPELAKKEFVSTRVRNLDDNEKGRNWINAMFLYKMTKDTSYLNQSKRMADDYLKKRATVEQFGDPMYGSHFFWPTFTNHWEEYLELYELTGDTTYLRAAHDGARHYALFTWMVPAIPDSLVTVNKGGKAPMYWYLKSKGHEQMYYPEEKVAAWRLSEIGLTPESSGTSTGHRGIFMSCFAPWMLRVGYYSNDSFLINLAKASLVGRSTNFPGYHINTERTTAYEKQDFPLREHTKQSVNSFHYNHILPMASLYMDYLVSDAYARSRGKIDFPNEYIEGYAYLQNKFYGHAKGKFYDHSNVQLWMPARLVRSESVELNYVAGRKGETLLLAFTNQSAVPVTTTITLNPKWLNIKPGASLKLLSDDGAVAGLKDSSFVVTVPAKGIAAVAVKGIAIHSSFQSKILAEVKDKSKDFASIPEGNAKAMLFKLGSFGRRLFVYLEDDDNTWQKAALVYTDENGKKKTIEKTTYPFEFTVDADLKKSVKFSLVLTDISGKTITSKTVELGK
jgi:hypothetical protein